MQQHQQIKAQYPDAILLFRVGDFYETFGEDAVLAARVLHIALTKRNNQHEASDFLAGFPHHALDTYLYKLVKAGYRVAVCDQLEDPKLVKGLVKRGVTELVTPGVTMNDRILEGNSPNFLAAVCERKRHLGIAFLDISTGDFFVAEGDVAYIDKLLQSLKPSEVLVAKSFQTHFKTLFGSHFLLYPLEEWLVNYEYAYETLLDYFQVASLKGFGVADMPNACTAAALILRYLKEARHTDLKQITRIQRLERSEFLWLDKFTVRNLELLQSNYEKGHSLLSVIDKTQTAMGGRLLKKWLIFPLRDKEKIDARLNAVDYLLAQRDLAEHLTRLLRSCVDIERFIARITSGKSNPRELTQLADTLGAVAGIKQQLSAHSEPYLCVLAGHLDPLSEVKEQIEQTIAPEPPLNVQKGNFIQKGVNERLDDYHRILGAGTAHIEILQQEAIQQTGIISLKMGYHSVHGYYFEVPNSYKNRVPGDWVRKQTLSGAERYITEALKMREQEVLEAQEQVRVLELEVYQGLIQFVGTYIENVQKNALQLAQMDCILSAATLAHTAQYVRPRILSAGALALRQARHPIIEHTLPQGQSYIGNDIYLDKTATQIMLLTGPNMSGKSALLRQTALITLMAHMGYFVPCTEAKIPLVDRIFTRVGANDNLSAGESTFMVEMNETAEIINNLSDKSLILLDEIGRGTSTYDGLSIASAVLEYLHEHPYRPMVLFATHYHELSVLSETLMRVQNCHIAYQEVEGKVIFLRKLMSGSSVKSFGIYVAKLSGLPSELIARAQQILLSLEKSASVDKAAPALLPEKKDAEPKDCYRFLVEKLNDMDVDNMTPVEALLRLSEIKALL